MAMKKKYRLQFDFSEEAYQELKRLQAQDGVSSEQELIRNAIGTHRYISDELHAGSRILVKKKDGETKDVEFEYIKPS